MKFVFFNIGWMERYKGLQDGDEIIGGGSYVKIEGCGHEVCNFAEVNGTLYGYVQPPGSQIDIDRLGAQPDDDEISNITVVWTATRPTGGTAVIGWYKNATVFRNYQKFARASKLHHENGVDGYWACAEVAGSKLLSVNERTCEIPRQIKGGMGQSNVWYADSPESAEVVARVQALVSGKRNRVTSSSAAMGKQDQERKAEIEHAAIRACCEHFEHLGYLVKSVEKDNLGWDLEASSGKTVLRIEVKGLSGSVFSIELTPNEYLAFSENSESYRLAVVTSALSAPKLSICRYSTEQKNWIVEDDVTRSLEIQMKKSASVKCR